MSSRIKTLVIYLTSALISLILILFVFKIFDVDVGIPFSYRRDALHHYNFAKNIEETGWWFRNPKFGAPLEQRLYDFPLSENTSLLVIKTLLTLGLDWTLSVNVFYILTFPLTTVISLWVMKKLNISYLIAIPLSIIYAFIPYHLYRGVDHLFLSAYFFIPLAIYSSYKLATKDFESYRLLLIFMVLLSSIGAYYTFFSAVFIGSGILIGWLKEIRDKSYILKSFALLAVLGFFFILNISPSLIHDFRYGKNLNAVTRPPEHTEIYGLKVTQLILPIEDHNLEIFNKVRKKYKSYGLGSATVKPLINENQYASLGLTTSFAFLGLLFWSLFNREIFGLSKGTKELLSVLGKLNLIALLYGTIGGFSLLVSLYLYPIFRSVNRISIFIAFISLLALGAVLENLKVKKKIVLIVVSVLLPFSMYDQISKGSMQNFNNHPVIYSDFVSYSKEIENTLNEGDSVFVLPFHQYPEGDNRKVIKIPLLTKELVWSAGAPSWRSSSYWQYEISQLPSKDFLETIINQGFKGLLVYRPRVEKDKMQELTDLIEVSPIVGPGNNFYFFDLREYASKNNIQVTPEEILYHISGNCVNDFNGESRSLSRYWCVNKGFLVIENISGKSKTVDFLITLETPDGGMQKRSFELEIEPGLTKVNLVEKLGLKVKGVFPKPYDQTDWPSYIDYPNFIIREVSLVE